MSLVGKTIEFLSGHDYTQDSNGKEIIKKAEIIDKFLGYETLLQQCLMVLVRPLNRMGEARIKGMRLDQAAMALGKDVEWT